MFNSFHHRFEARNYRESRVSHCVDILNHLAVMLLCFAAASSTARAADHFNVANFEVGKIKEHNGVLILSSGAKDKCVSMATFLYLAPRGATSRRQRITLADVDGWASRSDFDEQAGKLVAVALPPGEYEIFPAIRNPFLIRASAIPVLMISIGADEVVYGGEVYLPQSCGLRDSITVNDRHERDFALLKKLNPDLAEKTITVRLGVLLAAASK